MSLKIENIMKFCRRKSELWIYFWFPPEFCRKRHIQYYILSRWRFSKNGHSLYIFAPEKHNCVWFLLKLMHLYIFNMKIILEYIALSTFNLRNKKIWPLVTNFVRSSFCYTNFWAYIHTLGRRGDRVRVCSPILSNYKESVLHFVKNGKIFLLQNFNFSSLLYQLYPKDWHSRTLLDGDLFIRLLVFSNTVKITQFLEKELAFFSDENIQP